MSKERTRRTKEELQQALDAVLEEAKKWDDVFEGAGIRRIQIHSHQEAEDITERIYVERRNSGRYTLSEQHMYSAKGPSNDLTSETVAEYMASRGFKSLTSNPFIGDFYRGLERQGGGHIFREEAQKRGINFLGLFIE